MRTRAYVPEVPVCLESRSLLSSVAGLSADPVFLSRKRIKQIVVVTQAAFDTYATREHHLGYLRDDLSDVTAMVPFQHADGLNLKINGILDTMRHELFANVPHAVRASLNQVVAADFAAIEARVQAGDVVVR